MFLGAITCKVLLEDQEVLEIEPIPEWEHVHKAFNHVVHTLARGTGLVYVLIISMTAAFLCFGKRSVTCCLARHSAENVYTLCMA